MPIIITPYHFRILSRRAAVLHLLWLILARYCDQLTQLPKSEEWGAGGSLERMGALEWESALDTKIESV